MDYELYQIQELKDDEASPFAQHRLNLTNPLVASLADYDIDATTITDWQAAIDAHTAIVAVPRAAIVARSGNIQDLVNLFATANEHLKETIDTLMKPYRVSNASLYFNYQKSRVIVDRGTSSSGNGNDPGADPATFQGTTTDADTTNSIENALIELFQGGELKYSTNSNASGEFQISNITPGTYDIEVSAENYIKQTGTDLVFTTGETRTEDIELNTSIVNLSGQATDANTLTGLANAEIQVVTSEETFSIFTDVDGNYAGTINLNSSEDVTFHVIAPSYIDPAPIHTLAPGGTYEFDFALQPQA